MKIIENNLIEHLNEIDLFICSSGFESRSKKVALSLSQSLVAKAIVFHMSDTYRISNEHLSLIEEHFNDIEKIIYPKNAPLDTFDIFYSTLKNVSLLNNKAKLKTVIDISTFTREILLILIKVLSLPTFANFDVKIIYTPNKSYANNSKNAWMTRGVRDIRSIVGYSGLLSPSKKTVLIILAGFEEERTENIIDSFEPYHIILGKPSKSDSITNELSEIADNKYNFIKKKYEHLIVEEFEFSCISYENTFKSLDKIIKKFAGFNLIVSPLNNKISTVGVAMSALKNEELQVCYASANQYNIDAENIECDYFMLFDLNF
ncbi:hypothetical protein LNP04_16980 [Chryseobacterium sp. C-71]|uniref:hypothetical protein n=1 Tax=Chryseobacterium sp. C-71 TaxID=2893882 RepID=UPI001E295942|nr:hypothetical protein [Chryseobacterium sp. C-71]UFH31642.1 hypothetical protein LNP04_16980 [Chryseobacterium sp. C-71]